MIDGLKSHTQVGEDAGHGNGFMTLGCTPLTPAPGSPDFFIPGGITFAQHLAKTISSSTVRRSVLIAQGSKPDDEFKSNMFAEDRNKPLPAFQSPTSLYKDLFGDGMAQAAGVGTEAPNNRLLFDGVPHNYHFTFELNTKFKYKKGQVFTFFGDDDLWVFIDKKLALDAGGLHGRHEADVQLDTLNLVEGMEYELSVFHAERRTDQSNFEVTTNITFTNCNPILR
ncbi:MAG: fibro-slime domain-containing protein [Polyangiaceae bacterium]|nr:fibro-slime domain-containing protein [Polyangiaceae bacterium]